MAPAATTAVVVPSASPASALDDQVSPHRAPPDAILVTFAGKTACVPFSCDASELRQECAEAFGVDPDEVVGFDAGFAVLPLSFVSKTGARGLADTTLQLLVSRLPVAAPTASIGHALEQLSINDGSSANAETSQRALVASNGPPSAATVSRSSFANRPLGVPVSRFTAQLDVSFKDMQNIAYLRHRTGLDRLPIRTLHTHLKDVASHDGVLSKAAFDACMLNLIPGHDLSPADHATLSLDLSRIYYSFAHTGTAQGVPLLEFTCGFLGLAAGDLMEKLRYSFHLLDHNEDGVLSSLELVVCIRSLLTVVMSLCAKTNKFPTETTRWMTDNVATEAVHKCSLFVDMYNSGELTFGAVLDWFDAVGFKDLSWLEVMHENPLHALSLAAQPGKRAEVMKSSSQDASPVPLISPSAAAAAALRRRARLRAEAGTGGANRMALQMDHSNRVGAGDADEDSSSSSSSEDDSDYYDEDGASSSTESSGSMSSSGSSHAPVFEFSFAQDAKLQILLSDVEHIEKILGASRLGTVPAERVHQAFAAQADGARMLTKDAYDRAVRDLIPGETLTLQEQSFLSSVLCNIFETYDRDNLNLAPLPELASGFTLLAKGTKSEKLSLAFACFDDDNCGALQHRQVALYVRCFLDVLFALNSRMQTWNPMHLQHLSNMTAVDAARGVVEHAGGAKLIKFETFAEYYNKGGHEIVPWLELLDLSKWPNSKRVRREAENLDDDDCDGVGNGGDMQRQQQQRGATQPDASATLPTVPATSARKRSTLIVQQNGSRVYEYQRQVNVDEDRDERDGDDDDYVSDNDVSDEDDDDDEEEEAEEPVFQFVLTRQDHRVLEVRPADVHHLELVLQNSKLYERTPEEIVGKLRTFANDDGTISKKMFDLCIAELLPSMIPPLSSSGGGGGGGAGDAKRYLYYALSNVFFSFDRTVSSRVSLPEIASGMCLFGSGSKSDKLALGFSLFDGTIDGGPGPGVLTLNQLSVYLRSFLTVLFAVNEDAARKSAQDVWITVDTCAAECVAAVADSLGLREQGQNARLSFSDFADWYTDGGFELVPWIELLDLSKWPTSTSVVAQPTVGGSAGGVSAGGFVARIEEGDDEDDDDDASPDGDENGVEEGEGDDDDDDDDDEVVFMFQLSESGEHLEIRQRDVEHLEHVLSTTNLGQVPCKQIHAVFAAKAAQDGNQDDTDATATAASSATMSKPAFDASIRELVSGDQLSPRDKAYLSHVLGNIFYAYDRESSDEVTLCEFVCGFSLLSHGSKSEKLHLAFNLFDDDEDGCLTRAQLWLFLRSFLTVLMALNEDVATDPAEETWQLVDDSSVELTAKVLLQANRADPDLISFEEFASFYTMGGFELVPWLELLDLKKWPLPDSLQLGKVASSVVVTEKGKATGRGRDPESELLRGGSIKQEVGGEGANEDGDGCGGNESDGNQVDVRGVNDQQETKDDEDDEVSTDDDDSNDDEDDDDVINPVVFHFVLNEEGTLGFDLRARDAANLRLIVETTGLEHIEAGDLSAVFLSMATPAPATAAATTTADSDDTAVGGDATVGDCDGDGGDAAVAVAAIQNTKREDESDGEEARGDGEGEGKGHATKGSKDVLTKEAFDKCVTDLVPGDELSDEQKKYLSYALSNLFYAFDRAGTGHVNVRQFASGFSILGHGSKSDKLALAFNLFDQDQDGRLTGDEMQVFLRSFLTVLFALNEEAAGMPADDVWALVDSATGTVVERIMQEVSPTDDKVSPTSEKVSFEEFATFYTQGGFELMPWLELLNLDKWPTPVPTPATTTSTTTSTTNGVGAGEGAAAAAAAADGNASSASSEDSEGDDEQQQQ